MGLKAPLLKNNNRIGIDFIDAYWSIDDIRYSNADGVSFLAFNLNAYPSRDAKKNHMKTITTNYLYGAPDGIAVNSIIYSWYASFQTSEIFPNGIPLAEKEQKDALYPFVKKYCSDSIPFEDVFETDNLTEEVVE